MVKKFISLIVLVCMVCCLVACGEGEEQAELTSNLSSNNTSKYEHVHSYSDATCTSPRKCSCGVTSGSALGHSYSGAYCIRCGLKNPNYTYENNTVNTHTHYYTSTITKNATCGSTGIKTFKCSCGHSYTETIAKSTLHNWEYATCTKPDTCKDCGATRGSAYGHNYYSSGECSRCGQMDPAVNETLSKCSLSLPSLPKTITNYKYNGSVESKVEVTKITYDFEYYGNGKVILTAKFSGKKTYDYRGSGQNDYCSIGWKLYDPNGDVFRTGTFDSPSIAMGDTFSNQEEDLIYNFEATIPGAFRLEIMDVN